VGLDKPQCAGPQVEPMSGDGFQDG